jgi:hypothetical protein
MRPTWTNQSSASPPTCPWSRVGVRARRRRSGAWVAPERRPGAVAGLARLLAAADVQVGAGDPLPAVARGMAGGYQAPIRSAGVKAASACVVDTPERETAMSGTGSAVTRSRCR